MMDRVVVDIEDDMGQVSVGGDFLFFKIGDKQTSFSIIHFVVCFGIAVEEVAELLNDVFRFRFNTFKVFRKLEGLAPVI